VALFSTLVDDFASGALDPARWDTIAGASVVGGAVRLTPNGETFTQLRSVPQYAIAGSQVAAKVTAAPATGTTMATGFRVGPRASSGDDIGFWINASVGTIRCELRAAPGTVISPVSAFAYDPAAHAWLRIRCTDTTIVWETSPSGLAGSWTPMRSLANVPAWAAVENQELRLTVQRTGGTAGPYATLDNVNVAAVAPGGTPIVDDFAATSVSAVWSASRGTPTQIGGRMILDADDALISSTRVSMAGSAQWVDLFSVPTDAGREAVVSLASPSGSLRFRITVDAAGTTLTGESVSATGVATRIGSSLPFDLAAMHLLQFRESNGLIFLEYGSALDAMTALEPAGRAASFAISSFDIEIYERVAEGAVLPGSYAATYGGTY
jgi:hypothetical protein